MARRPFGGTTADVAQDVAGDRIAGAQVTVWTAATGGTKLTDLQTPAGVALTNGVVRSDANGIIAFLGPADGTAVVYVDGGVGGRTMMVASDLPDRVALLEAAPGGVTSVAGRSGAVTLAKADVGLGNVDNTADTAKPVSTAQQTALNLKANLASPALTGTPTAPTAASSDNSTTLATTAFVKTSVGSSVAPFQRGLLPRTFDAVALGEVPTITTSSSATTITSNLYAPPKRVGNVTGAAWDIDGDTNFLVGGTPTMPADVASPNNRVRAPQIGGTNAQAHRYPVTISFLTDSPAWEYYGAFPITTFEYRLVVDGKLSIQYGSVARPAASGSIKFDFGTSKMRHISLTVFDPQFSQINYQPTYTLTRPQASARRLFAVGDSLTFGTSDYSVHSWPYELGLYLGCDEVWNAAIGGTAWTATDGSQFGGNRMPEIAPFIRPNDVVVFYGSRNDPSGTAPQLAAITAAVTATLTGTSQLVACKNVYVGTNQTVISTMAASVIAGAVAAGRAGIDASGWITGTGNVSSPAGNGNADRYISGADGVHFANTAALSYIARRWNSAIRNLLPV